MLFRLFKDELRHYSSYSLAMLVAISRKCKIRQLRTKLELTFGSAMGRNLKTVGTTLFRSMSKSPKMFMIIILAEKACWQGDPILLPIRQDYLSFPLQIGMVGCRLQCNMVYFAITAYNTVYRGK